ncbi:MAG: ribosome-associated translation inhibitor RaiA [Deltaproteobacteria bacterium]|nr:ribosome-associated translation inhibitor RaiA [Deltaproteobacteria bacterium]
MKVDFTFRQFEGTDELRDLIKSRVNAKLDKFTDGKSPEVRVTISTEKAWTYVDMVVNSFGDTFKCTEKTTDLYPTIDVVLDKIQRQLQRKKDLFQARRKKGA